MCVVIAVANLMCAVPESIDNGGYQVVPEDGIDASSEMVRSSARAVYYCDSGYRVSPQDITAITCVDGSWSDPAPVCQRRGAAEYCTAVPVVAHARHYEVTLFCNKLLLLIWSPQSLPIYIPS